ncbi:hypothetical protein VTN96DRAFT_7895 [Rasamsonia emersonii]
MEDPVKEIPTVIRLLTQSPPSLQQATIEKFFTPSASFTHPFCSTRSFDGSRWLIVMIYRFYKIMSPRIDLEVKSVAFDEPNLKLYVTISQLFAVFLIPFYRAPVTLTVVLTLTTDPWDYSGRHGSPLDDDENGAADGDGHSLSSSSSSRRYWIAAQEDLYQTTEFVKFFLPYGIGVCVVLLWHMVATAACVLGAIALWPVTWLEERGRWPLSEGCNITEAVKKAISDIPWRQQRKKQ